MTSSHVITHLEVVATSSLRSVRLLGVGRQEDVQLLQARVVVVRVPAQIFVRVHLLVLHCRAVLSISLDDG